MKRFYFRAGVLPYTNVQPESALYNNYLGSNSGNLLYQYSVMKTLMTSSDDVLECNKYRVGNYSPEYVNENFDYFIIPLADAFRESFVFEMDLYTDFVKQLKIPCIVTGIGLRNPYEPNFKEGNSVVDSSAKEFINAVLDKSALIGLRGEITADYLEYLGYKEGKHFSVIGCPSMYSNGANLDVKPYDFSLDSKICLAQSWSTPKSNKRIIDLSKKCKNSIFVPQHVDELKMMYIGFPHCSETEFLVNDICSDLYREGRMRFFLNATTWYKYMEEVDFTIGSRLHGNIASIIGGTPNLLITSDSRTRELASYHKLNSCTEEEFNRFEIADLIKNSDYSEMKNGHLNNFRKYLEFLNANGLKTIYDQDLSVEKSPLDEIIKKSTLAPAVVPLDFNNKDILREHLMKFSKEVEGRIERDKKIIRSLETQIGRNKEAKL